MDTTAAGDRLARFDRAAQAHPAAIWIERLGEGAAPPPAVPGGALDGLLLAVKDNIDVAGFATTAACPAYAYRPEKSATVVSKLQAAGAVVVGKTNLDQFACGLVGTRSPYGEVPNAFNPAYVSGGSSSGSAVAVSLGLVDIALGTDTAGSGRVPAGFNNIVGIKPSRGLLSLAGCVPACRHLDCVSVFARTVPLALQTALAAAGVDPLDPLSRALTLDPHFLPETPRVGIPDDVALTFFDDAAARTAFQRAQDVLAGLGVAFVNTDFRSMAAAAGALYEDAWVAERYQAIAEFFDSSAASIDPVVRDIIGAGKRYSAADLFGAAQRLAVWRQDIGRLWDTIDVLVVPTAPLHPTRAAVRAAPVEVNRQLGYYTNFVNLLDLAAIAVPGPFRPDGLPAGVTLIGPSGSELRLADLAERFHRASGVTLGATGMAYDAPQTEPFPRPAGSTVQVAVVGAHLYGFPLNFQLTERGARRIGRARTAPCYRLFRLPDTTPAKPGLARVPNGMGGVAIELEIWEVPTVAYGSFVSLVPPPLSIGTLDLEDGAQVQGFLCESAALAGAEDISQHGGWARYQQALKSAAPNP